MAGSRSDDEQKDVTPAALKDLLAGGAAVLIDVREPDEFAAERIAGAINMPLSSFDPARVPAAAGKTVVLQCAGGKRSGIALDRCRMAQTAINRHLAGGIGAWKAAGLPVVRG